MRFFESLRFLFFEDADIDFTLTTVGGDGLQRWHHILETLHSLRSDVTLNRVAATVFQRLQHLTHSKKVSQHA